MVVENLVLGPCFRYQHTLRSDKVVMGMAYLCITECGFLLSEMKTGSVPALLRVNMFLC